MAGLEPLVVFWSGWGIHFMVLLSFTLQAVLLLSADIRRRKDWIVLKVIIWSAYMLADTTAIYALGHMSVLCRSPEHHLMALWAPLLLVHLGGQDNITAYAIEDNSLWLRHLKEFGLQFIGAAYVLYVSSILSSPPKVLWAAILMFVVGVLKYGERVWALMCADSCASSSLSATSYKKDFHAQPEFEAYHHRWHHHDDAHHGMIRPLAVAYILLDIPKKMFEGPTRYVKLMNTTRYIYDADFILKVVGLQLSMMYDLLYTKAAVVHTWFGLFSRVISLAFTVTTLRLFLALSDKDGYSRVDVAVTKVLLIGAVILETMSFLRAVFSKWTALLLLELPWNARYHHEFSACGAPLLAPIVYKMITFANLVGFAIIKVEFYGKAAMQLLLRRETYWSGCMRQHNFFKVCEHTNYSTGSKIAERIGREDLWDSMFYSWTTYIPPEAIIGRVVYELGTLVDGTTLDVSESQGLNALRRNSREELMQLLTKSEDEGEGERLTMRLELDESILVWHIATNVYIAWLRQSHSDYYEDDENTKVRAAVEVLSNYMFFLLAARPYMLPYLYTRRKYVQLCDYTRTYSNGLNINSLLSAIDLQREDLMRGAPMRATPDGPLSASVSINPTLTMGCQIAADLIHRDNDPRGTLDMIQGVWVEMLCYTAYQCNESFHAKHLSGGGDIITIVALLMIYKSRGFFR